MKDLTTGSVSKNIIYFAMPMFIGNVVQQLYNTVDGIIIGTYEGTNAQAAIGASFTINFLLVSLIMGLTMGATIIISQYYGAKDDEKVKASIDTTYVVMAISIAVVTIMGLALSGAFLRLMKVPPEVYNDALVYLRIMFAGTIFVFGYNAIASILRGLGDSKTPTVYLIIASIVNIILDIVFVAYMGLGVMGVALGTIIAQSIAFILGLRHLNKNYEIFRFNIKNIKFDKVICKKTITVGLPTGIQQMASSLGLMVVQGVVNSFGATTMATYFIASRVDALMALPAMSMGAALSAFTGQNIGADRMDRVKEGFKVSVMISAGMAVTVTIFLYLFDNQIISIFNSDPEVIAQGVEFIRIVAPFYVLICTYFMAISLVRGAGDTVVPMFINFTALCLVRMPVAYFLSPILGPSGIWWGTPIGWIVGFCLTMPYYFSGRWKKKIAIKNMGYKDEKSETLVEA